VYAVAHLAGRTNMASFEEASAHQQCHNHHMIMNMFIATITSNGRLELSMEGYQEPHERAPHAQDIRTRLAMVNISTGQDHSVRLTVVDPLSGGD